MYVHLLKMANHVDKNGTNIINKKLKNKSNNKNYLNNIKKDDFKTYMEQLIKHIIKWLKYVD